MVWCRASSRSTRICPPRWRCAETAGGDLRREDAANNTAPRYLEACLIAEE